MPLSSAQRVGAALLLAGVLAAALLRPAQPVLAQPPARDKASPFGMVTAIGNRVRSDEIDRYVALLREAGVQWVREEIFWDRVQREPGGPFFWNGDGSGFYDYDRSIAAQAAAGIHVMGLLDYNPAWFKGQAPPLEAWIADWGNYVYETVARYGRSGQAPRSPISRCSVSCSRARAKCSRSSRSTSSVVRTFSFGRSGRVADSTASARTEAEWACIGFLLGVADSGPAGSCGLGADEHASYNVAAAHRADLAA